MLELPLDDDDDDKTNFSIISVFPQSQPEMQFINAQFLELTVYPKMWNLRKREKVRGKKEAQGQ